VTGGAGADCVYDLIGGTCQPSPVPNQSRFRVFGNAWRKRCTATMTHGHELSASNNRLQLSCFKQGVRVYIIEALLVGRLRITVEAQQPLKLKRSTLDRIMI
jgi:hypothetical protein